MNDYLLWMKNPFCFRLLISIVLTLELASVFAQPILSVEQLTEGVEQRTKEQEKERYLDSLFQTYLQVPKNEELSSIYYHLGYRYLFFPNFQKAEKALKKAIYHAGENTLLLGKAHWKLGESWMRAYQLDSSIWSLQIAREILEKEATPQHLKYFIRTLRNLGNVYEEKGDYEQAHLFLTAALEQYETVQDTFYTAFTLNRLGVISFRRNQLEQSLNHLENAEQLYASFKGPKRGDYQIHWIDVILNKGNTYKEKEAFDLAIKQYQLVIDQLPPTEENAIIAQINKGLTFYLKKEYDRVIKIYNNVLKTQRSVLDTDFAPLELGPIYDNLGDAYLDKKQYLIALSNYQLSIKQYFPDFQGEADDLKNPDFEEMPYVGSLRYLLNPLGSKANTLQLLYANSKEEKYLKAALVTYKTVDELIDRMRAGHQEELSKLYWRENAHPLYGQAIETAYQLNDLEAVFYFMEKSKAVLLADELVNQSAIANTNLPQAQQTKIKELKSAIYAAKQSGDQQLNYLSLKEELADLMLGIETDYPAYYQFKYNLKVPDLSTLRNELLDDTTAFSGFFVSDSVLYSLQISKEEEGLEKLNYSEKDRREWQEMLQLATRPNLLETQKKEQFLSSNKRLTDRLWKPVSPKVNRYLIAPDGWLNRLNFEMLVTEYASEKVVYLIHDNTFNYTWSATVSQFVNQQKSKAAHPFLGIAPVDFPGQPDLEPLENSIEELRAIQKIISGKTLTHQQANTEELQKALADNYQIVHWATHAQANGKEPFIALRDQQLPLSQIYQLDFSNTEMVVLSTCESSTGKWQAGEGIASLARACLFAGSKSVVASQWSVNDLSTAILMGDFYRNLARELPKDQALRQAKLALLSEGAAPANWAAFITVGSAAPIVGLAGGGVGFWWWLVLGMGVLFIVVWRRFG